MLTLSGGTLANTVGLTLVNNVVVTANTTNPVLGGHGGGYLQLNGSITGSGTLVASTAVNSTNVRFGGNDSGFAGTCVVPSSGALYLASANSASAAAVWQLLGSGATAMVPDTSGTFNFGSLSGSGGIQGQSSGTQIYSIGALNQSTVYSGVISQSGPTVGVSVVGTGTLTLTGASTYSGATTINPGATLQIGNGGTTGSLLSTGTIADNGNLVYDYSSSGSVTIPTGSQLSGSGNISATAVDITLSGTIAVGGSQSYTEVGGGGAGQGIYITPSATTSLTGSSISLFGDVGGGGGNGTLQLNTSASNGPISLNISLGRSGVFNTSAGLFANSGTGTISVVGSGPGSIGWTSPVTLTGAVNISAPLNDTSTLTVNPTAATASSVSGTLSGGMSLVVGGPGTVALTASNAYTGSTTVNAGTLIVSGSLSGSGPVTVNGGTLGGYGSITGNTEIAAAGTVAPGAASATSGTMTLGGNLALDGSAGVALNLDSTRPVNAQIDFLKVAGTLSIGSNDTLTVTLLNTASSGAYQFALGGTVTGTFANVNVTGANAGSLSAAVDYSQEASGELTLDLVAVPEPGTWASILGGLGLLCVYQRRRQPRLK